MRLEVGRGLLLSGSRLPSILPMIGCIFSACTWNARALCCADRKIAKAKGGKVHELSLRFHLICLNEINGTEEDLRIRLSQILKTTHDLVFHSGLLTGEGQRYTGGGGIALLASKQFGGSQAFPPPLILANGRIGRVTILQGPHTNFIYPVHNFDISSGEMKNEEQIWKDIASAQADPMLFSVLLLGDMNLEPIGSKRISLPNPVSSISPELIGVSNNNSNPRAKRWENKFDKLVEVCTSSPTHSSSAQLYLNKLDRIFTSVPRTSLCLFQQKSGTVKDPVEWFVKGLSDHAPVYWEGSECISKPQAVQRVRPEWCEHPVFVERFEMLYQDPEMHTFSIPEQNVLFVLYHGTG